MVRPKPALSVPALVIIVLSYAIAATELEQFDRLGSWCSGFNFTAKSSYHQNLVLLLSSLKSKALNSGGFYASNTSETVYAAFLCRGDATPQSCVACVSDATANMPPKECPSDQTAVIWYNKCMIRYSNVSFLGDVDENAFKIIKNEKNITSNATGFLALAGTTLNELATQFSSADNQDGYGANSTRYFATRKADFSNFVNLYAMAQCTPDLTPFHCSKCLSIGIVQMGSNCSVSQGCRVLNPSCNARYENYPFEDMFSPASPTSIPAKSRRKGISVVAKIAICILALLLVMAVVAVLFYFHRIIRKNKKAGNSNLLPQNSSNTTPKCEAGAIAGVDFSSTEYLLYDFSTLQRATNNFANSNKLGEGGFGSVYKGILSNGQEVAVKRLSKDSNQGAEQFKNEVIFVANLQHRNLVRLLGYCLTQEEKLLIYEFVPNKSLDMLLFDTEKQGQLDWLTRYKIIQGIARGILYLHEDSRLKIVHRDVKASNILLDAEMNPKISDFGLARNFKVNQKQDVTMRPAGTFGYMAPEYLEYGEFSVQSDVYSFGVLVLEIISGRSINNRTIKSAENLLTFAWKNWIEDTPNTFVDSSLGDSYSRNEVMRCIQLGLLCVQGNMNDRPSMISIVSYLNSDLALPMPEEPVFLTFSSKTLSSTVEEQSSERSNKIRRSSSRTTCSKSVHSLSETEV